MRATNSKMAFRDAVSAEINLSHTESIPGLDALGGDGRREMYKRAFLSDHSSLSPQPNHSGIL